MKGSILLYTGHLILVLLGSDPQALLQPMAQNLLLAAQGALRADLPGAIKSFLLPFSYCFNSIQD